MKSSSVAVLFGGTSVFLLSILMMLTGVACRKEAPSRQGGSGNSASSPSTRSGLPTSFPTHEAATRLEGFDAAKDAQNKLLHAIQDACSIDDKDSKEQAAKMVHDLLGKVERAAGQEAVKKICEDIRVQADIWKFYDKDLPLSDYLFTIQLRSYYFLTCKDLDRADKEKLDSQRSDLIAIMAKVPERMVQDFHVPNELKDQVNFECKKALSHYEEVLRSPFIRCSQMPMPDEVYEGIKKEMLSEIDRLGKALSGDLEKKVDGWKDMIERKKTKLLPEDMGASLLDQELSTSKMYIVFFHGMALRTYMLPLFAKLDKTTDLFPFGRPDSYGINYRLRASGALFWAKAPKSDANDAP